MSTSVIIPTYNGAHKILNLLHSLEIQSLAPDEVIVVIDGSTDGTAELLRSKQFSFKSFRIVEQANGGRAQVRNRGAREAACELLVFFDDDMRPVPECLQAHVLHHDKHPGSILTGVQQEEILPNSTDVQIFKASLSKKWNEPLAESGESPLQESNAFLTAANFSIPKSLWELLEGFDQRLSDAEDYDLATRAITRGIPLFFDAKAFAWHDDLITCAGYIRRLRQYAQAHLKLQTLKPELYSSTHRFAVRKPSGAKAIFFKMFCSSFWIKTIDNDFWTFLPVAQRYRLYDWVVTSNGSFYPEKVRL